MAEINSEKRVVVLGAGVIGLTTALKLQETGKYHVEIITEVRPDEPKTIKYTSHWAGAYHVIDDEKGTPGAELQTKTFHEMWALSEPGNPAENCFLRCKMTHYFATEQPRPHYLEQMPNFQEVSKDSLPQGANFGFSFDSITIDVPVYLNYLLSQFLDKGGVITTAHVQHIDQLLETHSQKQTEAASEARKPPIAVVVCTGLGTRTLGGVEDQDVYPARGQTVIVNAPWVRSMSAFAPDKKTWTYVIPRKSGNVVLGGTKEADDWFSEPRPETKNDILQRALALCPELAPQTGNKSSEEPPKVESLLPLIVDEGVGLRPMRKGGPRIEVETKKGVPVVYNYGHGAEGYIKSIGSAYLVLQLLEEAIAK